MDLQKVILILADGLRNNPYDYAFYEYIRSQFSKFEKILCKADSNKFNKMLIESGELYGNPTKKRFMNLMKIILGNSSLKIG